MSKLTELFGVFFKIGAFTFGGGYAMIPLIQREIIEKKKYIKENEMIDMIAVAESTPGPIAINMATFVGYRIGGFTGALVSTFGIVLPSFLVILVISFFLRQFESIKAVSYAFSGIRVGVLALMLHALTTLWKQSPKGAVPYIIMLLAFVCVAFLKFNVILVMASSAAIGLASFLMSGRAGEVK
jgi:chromate transporter